MHIGMLLQGTHGKAPANIIDEAIDGTMDKIINQNIGLATNQRSSSIPKRFATNNNLCAKSTWKPILCHHAISLLSFWTKNAASFRKKDVIISGMFLTK